jgi:hypothetical protein
MLPDSWFHSLIGERQNELSVFSAGAAAGNPKPCLECSDQVKISTIGDRAQFTNLPVCGWPRLSGGSALASVATKPS